MATTVKLSSKQQIVVPKEARDALSVGPGDRLVVVVEGRTIKMEKLRGEEGDALDGALSGLGARGLWEELKEGGAPSGADSR